MPKTEPPDSSDLDALREMQRSPGYGLLVGRIESTIDGLHKDLERNSTIENTCWLRGEIAAYRTALTLPDILKGEISQEVKRGI